MWIRCSRATGTTSRSEELQQVVDVIIGERALVATPYSKVMVTTLVQRTTWSHHLPSLTGLLASSQGSISIIGYATSSEYSLTSSSSD